MTSSNILGDILKHLRKNTNYSQKDIAEKLGIAQTTYASYENNKREPNIATLINLADIYDVSLDFIAGREFNIYMAKRHKAIEEVNKMRENASNEEITKMLELLYVLLDVNGYTNIWNKDNSN